MTPLTPATPFGEHASPGTAASAACDDNPRQSASIAAMAEILFMALSEEKSSEEAVPYV